MPDNDRYLFTSESVSMGHPDKMADQISDGILDAILEQDPYARVACESLLTTGLVCLAGEITTKAMVDYPAIVRQVVREIGYTSSEMGFDAATCAVMVALGKQSPDIAQGVDEDSTKGKDIGAGDQGMMFGFACNETPEMMPLPIALAHRIINRITELRKNGTIKWLRPDSKSQVTVEYEGYTPIRIDTVVVSTQHHPDVTHAEIVERIRKEVIDPVLPAELLDGSITYHINPTGKFVIGGPHGDSGVTGRKIIVDTYGGAPADTAAVLSAARIPQRSTARQPIWHDTSPKILWRRGSPNGAKSSWPMPSAFLNPSAYTSIPRERERCRIRSSPSSSAGTSASIPPGSSNISTSAVRFTARPPAAATSGGLSLSSPGRRPTRQHLLREAANTFAPEAEKLA